MSLGNGESWRVLQHDRNIDLCDSEDGHEALGDQLGS